MTPERHIDNAYQRIDMAMGLIALGKAHALLGEALHELHAAIAAAAGTAKTPQEVECEASQSGGKAASPKVQS